MENSNGKDFIGRHEEFCLVKKLLGEEVPDLEIQIAKNRDTIERDTILNGLEEIEKYIRSKDFISNHNVLEVHNQVMKLVADAGIFCISKNDVVLGDRLYKILDDTVDYAKAKYEERGELTDEVSRKLNNIGKKFRAADFLTYLQLHDLLKTSDYQMGFYIWNSLVQKNAFIVTLLGFNKGMIKEGSTDKEREFVENYPKRLRKFAEDLLAAGRINIRDMKRIESEISLGGQ